VFDSPAVHIGCSGDGNQTIAACGFVMPISTCDPGTVQHSGGFPSGGEIREWPQHGGRQWGTLTWISSPSMRIGYVSLQSFDLGLSIHNPSLRQNFHACQGQMTASPSR